MKEKNNLCPYCDQEFEHLYRHMSVVHEGFKENQEKLVLEYYNQGLSAEKIMKQPGVFGSKNSILRLVKNTFSKDEIESRRVIKIGKDSNKRQANGSMDKANRRLGERNKTDEMREKNSQGNLRAYEDGTKVAWKIGLNKFNNPIVRAAADKVSDTMKRKAEAGELTSSFKSGEESPKWKNGITFENSEHRVTMEFTKGDRNLILRRANNCCQECGVSAERLRAEKELLDLPRWMLECDHIVPVAQGGIKDAENNGQALCVRHHVLKTLKETNENKNKAIKRYEQIDEVIKQRENEIQERMVKNKLLGGEVTNNSIEITNQSTTKILQHIAEAVESK